MARLKHSPKSYSAQFLLLCSLLNVSKVMLKAPRISRISFSRGFIIFVLNLLRIPSPLGVGVSKRCWQVHFHSLAAAHDHIFNLQVRATHRYGQPALARLPTAAVGINRVIADRLNILQRLKHIPRQRHIAHWFR